MLGDDRAFTSQTEALQTCWDVLEHYKNNR